MKDSVPALRVNDTKFERQQLRFKYLENSSSAFIRKEARSLYAGVSRSTVLVWTYLIVMIWRYNLRTSMDVRRTSRTTTLDKV